MASDDILDLQAFAQRPVVLVVVKFRGRALAAVPPFDGIVVQRESFHVATGLLHQHVGPVVVIVAGARGYLEEPVAVKLAAVGLIAAVCPGIVLGGEMPSAALVAYAEILELPGFLAAVLLAFLGHRAVLGGDILDPFGQLLDGAAADIAAQIWLAAYQLAQVEELVSAEAVVLDGASPVGVDHYGTVLLGADAVCPVILVGKAASRPAHHRHLEGA